jgi:hypothetical protein
MADWLEVEAALALLGGERRSPTAWIVTLQGRSEDRQQRVLVSLERMQPDLDFARIFSPLSMLSGLRADVAIRLLGQMTVGMTGFNPVDDDDGMVGIGTIVPLSCLDLSGPGFPLYLSILAQAADGVEAQLSDVDYF